MNTTVIIVAHNSEATLSACLQSVQANKPTQLIVVDNSSKPSSLATYTIPNQGFAAAANYGAKKATTDFLFFLNPDTVIPRTTLAALEDYFVQHPTVAVIGCQLIAPDGTPEMMSYGTEPTLRSLLWRQFLRVARAPLRPSGFAGQGWVSGAAMAVRRDVFESVGGFDPHFFLYWEDVDLCRRIRQTHTIAFLPDVQLKHLRGASQKDLAQKTRHYDQSADRYFRKHYATPIWYCQRLLRRLYRQFQPYSL